jgi:hypothetical protein
MTAEQKSKLAQGLFFGALFLCLGYFLKHVAADYQPVKKSGKFVIFMGGIIVAWGIWQSLAKPK